MRGRRNARTPRHPAGVARREWREWHEAPAPRSQDPRRGGPNLPMTTVAVIHARCGSTRFPRKVLAPLEGRPMLTHVVGRALRATTVDRVVVATTLDPAD